MNRERQELKIAIVHDEFTRKGGAEQVVLSFQKIFPSAPIYTMVYKENLTYPEFRESEIHTSWFQKIAINEKAMKYLFFPFGMLSMMRFKITGYDVVLISSTFCAKYPIFDSKAIVINYCHQPFRLVWNPDSYKQYARAGFIKKGIINVIIKILKKIDFKKAQRTDFYITNSMESKDRIKRFYMPKREVEIIHPPVKCSNFYISEIVGNFYLLVSRLEYYKRIDLAIEAFNALNKPLIVVGTGTIERTLKSLAGPNILFKGSQNSAELALLLSKCRALIFPQHEDFGITPLEANASGRPVIAYGKGGVLETMIPYENGMKNFTAVFFNEQTKEALINAVNCFETLEVNTSFIRKHAERFDEKIFMEKIKLYVKEKIKGKY